MNLLKSYSKIKSSVWNRQGKRNYNTLRFDDTAESLKLNKDRFITIAILAGIFGGLVGGPLQAWYTLMLLVKRDSSYSWFQR